MSTKSKIVFSELMSTLSSQIIFFCISVFLYFCISVFAVKYLYASSTEIGLLNTAAGLGTFLFLFLLSPLTDIKRTDIFLIILSIFRSIIAFYLVYLTLQNSLSITLLALFAFLMMGITALYESAFSAYIPKIVKTNELTSINSWIAGLRSAADIAAGSIAGFLMSYFGAYTAFLFVGIFYLLSTLGPLSFKKFFDKKSLEKSPPLKLWFSDTFHGFNILFNNPVQKNLNIGIVQFNLFTAIIQTMYILYLIRYAEMNEFEIGVSSSIAGIIGLSGVFLANIFFKNYNFKKIMGLSLFIPGLSGLLVVILPAIPEIFKSIVLGLSFGIWALCVIINITGFETLKQQTISETSLGRYSSASRCLTWGVDPIGALLGTFLALFLPLSWVLILACIGVFLSSFWIFFNPIFDKVKLDSSSFN